MSKCNPPKNICGKKYVFLFSKKSTIWSTFCYVCDIILPTTTKVIILALIVGIKKNAPHFLNVGIIYIIFPTTNKKHFIRRDNLFLI
ncbi:MAG: hypothetical protein A2Y15_09825 [Clostridiales bacterium GWF2_36_10]|nr:MAG: hypothetical protein A2Y15_09825 [Clostridiales bacterium GWF2_36_10]HAN20197.1 hypothetical protein [Clostridiales bacterium]